MSRLFSPSAPAGGGRGRRAGAWDLAGPRGVGKGVPWGQQGAGGKPAASAGGRGGRRGPAGGGGPASLCRFSRTPLTQLHGGDPAASGVPAVLGAQVAVIPAALGPLHRPWGSARLLNLTRTLVKVQPAWDCAFPTHSPGSAALPTTPCQSQQPKPQPLLWTPCGVRRCVNSP